MGLRALGTIATGALGETEAKRTNLVPTHAYALLDIRKVRASSRPLVIAHACWLQIGELRLIKLKNPWNRVRWQGHFSPNDKVVRSFHHFNIPIDCGTSELDGRAASQAPV